MFEPFDQLSQAKFLFAKLAFTTVAVAMIGELCS